MRYSKTAALSAAITLAGLLFVVGCDTAAPAENDAALDVQALLEGAEITDASLDSPSGTDSAARKSGRVAIQNIAYTLQPGRSLYLSNSGSTWRRFTQNRYTMSARVSGEDLLIFVITTDRNNRFRRLLRYVNDTAMPGGREETYLDPAELESGDYRAGFLFAVRSGDGGPLRGTMYREPRPSGGSSSFPSTVLTSRNSTSAYAGSLNAFGEHLRGQCTWYVYGRTVELARTGHLDRAAETALYDGLWGQSGRHAKNWPALVGGSWRRASQIPTSERRRGMIGVLDWGDDYGHVFFVEEVSSDGQRYRFSDYNRAAALAYSGPEANGWREFGQSIGSLGEPRFYVLPLD